MNFEPQSSQISGRRLLLRDKTKLCLQEQAVDGIDDTCCIRHEYTLGRKCDIVQYENRLTSVTLASAYEKLQIHTDSMCGRSNSSDF